MAKKRIFVDPDGNVIGLYDSKFGELHELGGRVIERVSDVEFDNDAQRWVATIRSNIIPPSHDLKDVNSRLTANTRTEALLLEQEFVERCLINKTR